MPIVARGLPGLRALAGTDLGRSSWRELTQKQVDTFADATGDHQWIHVDPERAALGPFGGTIGHGYLTLALIPELLRQLVSVEGLAMAVNYGLDRVRFPAPVPVGAKVRLGATLAAVTDVGDKAVQVVIDCTVETDAGSKPACVARLLLRWYA
jgi:acyl dehydratase